MTNTLISTPNIEGNIGSCGIETQIITLGRNGFWTFERKDITVNSCTGEMVQTNPYWEITGDGEATIILAFIVIAILTMSVIAWIVD